MKKCIVIIPIYKQELTKEEAASLNQCKKILAKYDIKYVCPTSLDICEYSKIADFEAVRFDDKWFKSVFAYSRMLVSPDFYQVFKEYEYMLIYQLDAWVFEDKLEYWCEQNYDYIGAPWFEKFDTTNINSKIMEYAGNGGFSLRKISTLIDILTLAHNSKNPIMSFKTIYTKEGTSSILNIFRLPKSIKKYFSKSNQYDYVLKFEDFCEDNLLVNRIRKSYPNFKAAKFDVAKYFSFEAHPSRLYKECNNHLPFGCHAFKKYDWDFWKNHINIED